MPPSQTHLMLGMGVVLVGLTALLVWGDPPVESDPGAPVWAPASSALNEADLEQVSWGTGSEAVAMVRVDGVWRLTHPLDAATDPAEAASLVAALSDLQVSEALGPTEGASYGLQPGVPVEAVLSTGVRVLVWVGDEVPTDRGTYLRLEDGSIRVSRGSFRDRLLLTPDRLRSRVVVPVSPAGVIAVRAVSSTEGSWSVARDLHGWWLSDPTGSDRADTDSVLDFLASLAALKVDTFVDGPGLLEPAWTLELETLDGTRALVLGEGEGEIRMVQGTAQEQPALVRLPPSLAALDPARFRARSLLAFAAGDLESYSLALGGQTRAADQAGEAGFDKTSSRVLTALAALEGDRARVVPAPQGPAWGSMVLEAAGGLRQEVTFFQSVDGGRVAVDPAGGDPFWVAQPALDAVIQSSE